jgi:hypothetical protein
MNSMKVTRLEPDIAHVPARKASPGNDIKLYATVNGPDDIARVRIRYGNLKQGYRYVSMGQLESGFYYGMIR